MAWLPNLLSILRIILAVPILLFSTSVTVPAYVATAAIVAVAMLTDALDGYIARRTGYVTEIGYVLDAMGDRAIHLALVLAVVVRFQLHPVLAWLLIFRDIGIYAIRLLSRDWLRRSLSFKWLSVVHASALRVWLLLFMVRDGVRIFTGADSMQGALFTVVHSSLLGGTLILAYYGLYRSAHWVIDAEIDLAAKEPE